jgi:CheY-like chemotaxis protein
MSVSSFSSVDLVALSEEESKPSLVLIIEDDRELAEEMRLDLQAGGHTVQVAQTLTDGLRAVLSGDLAVLVVDRSLHGEDGLSIVEALRAEGSRPLSWSSVGSRPLMNESRDLKPASTNIWPNRSIFAN